MLSHLINFLGGMGLFLYGMTVMADGLQKSMGRRMQSLLQRITDNRLLAVLVGTLVTALIQSSAATTIMVVGFVNAGILNLLQAVGVIMGANIGTTVTAWLVSLSQLGNYLRPETYAPLMIAIGAFYILMAKGEHKVQGGLIVLGFGMLFVGLSIMSQAVKPYQDSPIFADAFRVLGEYAPLGILVGLVVTALIQSSSASVGILQTLAISGLVSVRAAIFVTLGQNIGTCVTALLSSIGAQRNAKRAAILHLLFNLIGAVFFAVVALVFFALRADIADSRIDAVGISIFHTIFNISNTVLLFPFARQLVRLSEKLVRGGSDANESEEERLRQVLDPRLVETPLFALQSVMKEVQHMGDLAGQNVKRALHALLHDDLSEISQVYETERSINRLEERVGEYLVKIENYNLSADLRNEISHLFYTLNDLERIGDHAENIAQICEEMAREELQFSEYAKADLREIGAVTLESIYSALRARERQDASQAQDAKAMETRVDELEEQFREAHLQRMVEGHCGPKAGVHFLDVIANLERISDHAENIAGYVSEELKDTHVFAHAEHAAVE